MPIQNELDEFLFLCEEMRNHQGFSVESPAPYTLAMHPKSIQNSPSLGNKNFAFTVMALTHGNETGGVGVINALLRLILADIVRVPFPMALILGNIEAAQQGKRLWQSDLNRSFAVTSSENLTYEEKRAGELSDMLKNSLFFLDIHQTSEPSKHPFFIFPYTKSSYTFARAIGYRHNIVTHWGQPFSVTGKCTDAFVMDHGGTGISIELGQKGLYPEQIGSGLGVVLDSLGEIAFYLEKGHTFNFSKNVSSETPRGKLFTFAQIERYEANIEFHLTPGLKNFDPVRLGENLGHIGGATLTAKSDGFILFPKYTAAVPGKAGEALRIVKIISEADLPV